MSAFVCQDAVFHALVSYAESCERCRLPFGQIIDFRNDQQKVGQILLDENYRSVNHRYAESDEAPYYYFKRFKQLKPVEILSLCSYYSYQSCETENWPETPAYRLIDWIRDEAIRQLPGYDNFRPFNL